MKRSVIRKIICLTVFVGGIVFAIILMQNPRDSIVITNTLVLIEENGDHPANNRQYQSSVWLGTFDGKLYFYPHCGYSFRKTDYDGYLCVFEDGGVTKLCDLEKGKKTVHIQGYKAPFLYYWGNDTSQGKQREHLYSINLNSKENRNIYSGEAMQNHNSFFADNERLYFPLWAEYGKTPQFVCVKDGALAEVTPLDEGYCLNGKTYFAVAEYGDDTERILCQDENGQINEVPLGYAHHRSVIPCENGLLIHNESGPNILYWIDEAGNVQELFSVECLDSRSAVNVHENDVYISFKRYKEYGDIGMKRFENDSVEGTYRISLIDSSIQKISDSIYDGLYNFDDKCLYACDEDYNIFQIDFNGNVIQTLFRQS